jgi:hypothetical protein
MNIDQIILDHKCKKMGNPITTIKVADIPTDIFDNVKNTIYSKYNLEDEIYATKEFVFYETRRIVGKTPHMMTTEQKYSTLDFDYELLAMCDPIIKEVQKYLPNSEPALLQLATILPGQKLKWHIDTYLYQQFSNKIHIPLQTNEQTTYEIFLEDTTYRKDHMTAGSIWNINNLVLHRSVNLGTTARTHIIMDFIDCSVLNTLNSIGINYFHHNLPHMMAYSEKVMKILNNILRNNNE